MLYFQDLKLAILLIPKTGCQALRYGLRTRIALQRLRGGQCRHCRSSKTHCLPSHVNLPEGTRLAVFVRHPESWYRSWWAFDLKMQSLGMRMPITGEQVWHPGQNLFGLWRDDFKAATSNVLEHEPGAVTRLYEWFCGPEGAETVDFIGQQEMLQDHLNVILRHCGFTGPEVQLPRLNKSRSSRAAWDELTKAALLATEAPTIRRFYMDEPRLQVHVDRRDLT